MNPLIPRRGLLLALIGTLAAVVLVGAPPAHGQPPIRFPEAPQQVAVQIPGGGTDLFRALLDKEGIEPVRANEIAFLKPSGDIIVIVIGNIDAQNAQLIDSLTWVRRVLPAGGAALIASDSQFPVYDSADGALINNNNHAGWFMGEIVLADERNQQDTHRAIRDCPYAVPVSPDELPNAPAKPGPVWNVFRGLTRVATNQPTYLNLNPPRARSEYRYPLARLPQSSYGQQGKNFRQPPLLAVGNDGPTNFAGGRGYSFLAVADSSIFINQMLMEDGTDNLELTLRTIEYLKGPDPENPRKKCLFYENGRLVDRFDGLRSALAKPAPKVPPEAVPNIGPLFGKHQDKLVNFLDAKVGEIQDRDVLHRTMVGPPGSDRERRSYAGWVEGLTVLLTLIVGRFLLSWYWGTRSPQDVPPPPNTGAGAASTGPPGVFDRRQKEIVRRNNVYEPVRSVVREFFASVGTPEQPGPLMPRLEIYDEVRKPESLRQALRDMWRLAYGPPTAITAQRWHELEPYFERLKKAHADGKWRFLTDGA